MQERNADVTPPVAKKGGASGYLFIGNSSKSRTSGKDENRHIIFDNVVKPCIECAIELGLDVHVGVNRSDVFELTSQPQVKFYFIAPNPHLRGLEVTLLDIFGATDP